VWEVWGHGMGRHGSPMAVAFSGLVFCSGSRRSRCVMPSMTTTTHTRGHTRTHTHTHTHTHTQVLTMLDLGGNNISEKGATTLATALKV
jgi:hypothetical protein